MSSVPINSAKMDGKATRVHDIVRIGRNPANDEELGQLGFAAFNIYDLDGEDLSMNYETAMQKLDEIFSDGVLVHPVKTVIGENASAVLKQYKAWVVDGGDEGVVARSETAGVFKVKPKHNLDLAVIGFTESPDDRTGMLHDLLLAIVRQDGTFQIVSRVGGGFSDDQRREILQTLQSRVVESDFHEVNSARVAYQMVEPGLVIEIQCLDLVAMTSRGNPIDRMVLEWNSEEGRWEGLRRLPLCSIISPQFVRFRDDKQAQENDVRLSQLTDIVNIPDVDRVAEEIQLPASEVIKRAVGTKIAKGGTIGTQACYVANQQRGGEQRFPRFCIAIDRFLTKPER